MGSVANGPERWHRDGAEEESLLLYQDAVAFGDRVVVITQIDRQMPYGRSDCPTRNAPTTSNARSALSIWRCAGTDDATSTRTLTLAFIV